MLKRILPYFRSTALVLGLALLSVGQTALGQAITTAAFNGIITDQKGEPLPGATVLAVHLPTGSQYGTVTRADGRYNLPGVRVGGPYRVTATFVGYKEEVQGDISLTLADDRTTNFTLADNSAQLQEVVVTGNRSGIINAGRTGAATTVNRATITTLPTLSRSFGDFTRLDPRANGQSFAGRNSSFNNITIDGAVFNNSFGLSSTVGGQTNSQPISLDAIDQIQVTIAPYDVRQGSFTGAGINAVTRSGTNEFSGSVYTFVRNKDLVGKKIAGEERVVQEFNNRQIGFRLGGSIIKNKLFFFINAEQEKRSDPVLPSFVPFRAGGPAPSSTNNVSEANADSLAALRQFLISKYNYDPGEFEGYQYETFSQKATAKIDWNISQNHKFNIKYNYLQSHRDVNPSTSGALPNGRGPTNTNIPFQASLYRINNNLNSIIAELNSTFGNKFANTVQIGYTAFRDFRESSGGIFPTVDIGNGKGQSFTSFGYEPFSANNVLSTNVLQISDNFTIYAGKNTFTIGTYNEFYKFTNGFAPNYYGGYQFRSLSDFYASANGTNRASQYRLQYSLSPDGSFPFANIKARQFGFYVQDEIAVKPGLRLTIGVRADIPNIPTDIQQNTNAANLTFREGIKINTSEVQKTSLLWSPRVGFNWDVKNDRTLQVRGGAGVFTGRVPYVWISNQASNTGTLFGSFTENAPSATTFLATRAFSADVDANRPTGARLPVAYNIAVTDRNFKFPQVFRANLGIDKDLGAGFVLTLDGLYSKDLNAVYHINANLPNPTQNLRGAEGGDNRPTFYTNNAAGFPATVYNRIYGAIPAAQGGNTPTAPNISDAIVMKNTDQGYSYTLTAQLRKTFRNGLFTSVAYNYTDSKSVNDGGSIAQSIWRDRFVSGDPNANVLSYFNGLARHRVVASGAYQVKYAKFFGTTVSFLYNISPGSRFSYTYSGDLNGDGSGGGGNDLIFVPRDRNDIFLRNVTSGTTVTYSADNQWNDLNAYIEQDEYLKNRRGQYAERNGGVEPWVGQLDAKLIQDFYVNVGGKTNTLQLSVDVFNFGNLLNSDWGVYKSVNRAALLNFVGYDNTGAAATGRPAFQYNYLTGTTPLTKTFQNSFGLASRWQMQFGLRYIFN